MMTNTTAPDRLDSMIRALGIIRDLADAALADNAPNSTDPTDRDTALRAAFDMLLDDYHDDRDHHAPMTDFDLELIRMMLFFND